MRKQSDKSNLQSTKQLRSKCQYYERQKRQGDFATLKETKETGLHCVSNPY